MKEVNGEKWRPLDFFLHLAAYVEMFSSVDVAEPHLMLRVCYTFYQQNDYNFRSSSPRCKRLLQMQTIEPFATTVRNGTLA